MEAMGELPNLGTLDWVEVKYLPPEGLNEVRHTRDTAGNIQSLISAPKVV